MKLVALLGVLACSSPSPVLHDAPIDTASLEAGVCGADTLLVAENVDWLSTDAAFCGVFGDTWTVHGDATRTSSTAPNGRVSKLCIPNLPTVQIDITPPTAKSQCTVPMDVYTLPGIAIADRAVVATGDLFSARSMTTTELGTFFTGAGLTFDPTKAQVFIHIDGTPSAVSIDAAHDTAQAWSGTAWAAGTTGENVYFPNVMLTETSTNVSVTGGAIGTGTAPLVAGTFTYMTVVTN